MFACSCPPQVVLPSNTVISYTKEPGPVAKSDKSLKYGKYDLVKPWSLVPIQVHYETNRPFKKVSDRLALSARIGISSSLLW
jgi:hypothetical protein